MDHDRRNDRTPATRCATGIMPVAVSLSKRAADPYTSSVMSHLTLIRRPRVRDRSPDFIPRSTGIRTTANDPEQGSMVVNMVSRTAVSTCTNTAPAPAPSHPIACR
jgi:hypothetical protein